MLPFEESFGTYLAQEMEPLLFGSQTKPEDWYHNLEWTYERVKLCGSTIQNLLNIIGSCVNSQRLWLPPWDLTTE